MYLRVDKASLAHCFHEYAIIRARQSRLQTSTWENQTNNQVLTFYTPQDPGCGFISPGFYYQLNYYILYFSVYIYYQQRVAKPQIKYKKKENQEIIKCFTVNSVVGYRLNLVSQLYLSQLITAIMSSIKLQVLQPP